MRSSRQKIGQASERSLSAGHWSRRDVLRVLAGSGVGLACVNSYSLPLSGIASPLEIASDDVRHDRPEGEVDFNSSDTNLVTGFRWAKAQALAYVRNGDPVGPWFEASLPGRSAFCMRDTAHMCAGAQVLGMAERTKNMLRKFAQAVAASREWCSYWEIARDDRPASVDYENDEKFWYNLPANFDVLNACYRQFVWTGDRDYLSADFLNFYDHTVTDYVRAWDKDGDGLLDHLPQYGSRGIATYDEDDIDEIRVGADLVASQYAAYRDYANIQKVLGNDSRAAQFKEKAEGLKLLFNRAWWNQKQNRYFPAMGRDQSFMQKLPATVGGSLYALPLYFDVTEEGPKTKALLDDIISRYPLDETMASKLRVGVEGRTYLPDVFYRYGLSSNGYHALLALMTPTLPRREYPEVSYTVIGNLITGMMGIGVDPESGAIRTASQLPRDITWVAVEHLPIHGNVITVRHDATGKTTLTNESGTVLKWCAGFPARGGVVLSDGRRIAGKRVIQRSGILQVVADLIVQPEQSVVVTIEPQG